MAYKPDHIMKSGLQARITRFRAYQLGEEGSSFSYFDGSSFTLIEARLTNFSRLRLHSEMNACCVSALSRLHITSWDDDHCSEDELEEILKTLVPNKIEYPGYEPHTDNGRACLRIIQEYRRKNPARKVQKVDPPYISSLKKAEEWGYKNILYHPKYISESSNDNSTVEFFRSGSFNVASLGDVESSEIASYLKRCDSFRNETDIMILAHHGADNGFTTKSLLRMVKPALAICSSNYDNQFEHPDENIRKILAELGIPIYTTKTGDVIIESIKPHTRRFKIYNLVADSTEISSEKTFVSKKSEFLDHNTDTLRDTYAHKINPYKRFSR